jgi:hypothetical protein
MISADSSIVTVTGWVFANDHVVFYFVNLLLIVVFQRIALGRLLLTAAW